MAVVLFNRQGKHAAHFEGRSLWTDGKQNVDDTACGPHETAVDISRIQAKVKLKCKLISLLRIREEEFDDESGSDNGSEYLNDACSDVHFVDFLAHRPPKSRHTQSSPAWL